MQLMYHFICSSEDKEHFHNFNGLSVDQFKQQIQKCLFGNDKPDIFLKSESTEIHKKLNDLNEDFSLTFDDGLKQHITNVLPVLIAQNLSATFFVPGYCFMERYRDQCFLEKARLLERHLFNSPKDFCVAFEDAVRVTEKSALDKFSLVASDKIINQYLKEYTFYSHSDRRHRLLRDKFLSGRGYKMTILEMWKQFARADSILEMHLMDAKDVELLLNSGMHVGGHGLTHADLSVVTNAEAEKEIMTPKNILNLYME